MCVQQRRQSFLSPWALLSSLDQPGCRATRCSSDRTDSNAIDSHYEQILIVRERSESNFPVNKRFVRAQQERSAMRGFKPRTRIIRLRKGMLLFVNHTTRQQLLSPQLPGRQTWKSV